MTVRDRMIAILRPAFEDTVRRVRTRLLVRPHSIFHEMICPELEPTFLAAVVGFYATHSDQDNPSVLTIIYRVGSIRSRPSHTDDKIGVEQLFESFIRLGPYHYIKALEEVLQTAISVGIADELPELADILKVQHIIES